MQELQAGVEARLTFTVYDDDELALDDGDISTLTYSVYDVTNDAEVRASTSGPVAASGEITLLAADTAINGTGTREKRRVCIVANTDEATAHIIFWVVAQPCS